MLSSTPYSLWHCTYSTQAPTQGPAANSWTGQHTVFGISQAALAARTSYWSSDQRELSHLKATRLFRSVHHLCDPSLGASLATSTTNAKLVLPVVHSTHIGFDTFHTRCVSHYILICGCPTAHTVFQQHTAVSWCIVLLFPLLQVPGTPLSQLEDHLSVLCGRPALWRQPAGQQPGRTVCR